IRTLIKKLGKNHSVILSSHILPEVQAVCDRVVVIDKGKIVANDTAENLSRNMSADHKLLVQIEGPVPEVKALLEKIPGIAEIHVGREVEKNVVEYELNPESGADIRREVFKRMAARSWPILLMKGSELTLEEIFLKLTTGDFYGGDDSKKNGGTKK
ncbi:MAG: ABC transporter, partial [Oscillospiraceae bacterium]|nr:ABC transporter [Oscillospiraceae bacterium]